MHARHHERPGPGRGAPAILVLAALAITAPAGHAAAPPPDKAERMARYVHAEFERVCMEPGFGTEASATITQPERYTEYDSSDLEGEAWMEDTRFHERFGTHMTVRAGGEGRCQLAVWPEVPMLFRPLVERYEASGEHERTAVSGGDGDRALEFRWVHEGLPRPEPQGEVRVTRFRSGAVVIGHYRSDPIVISRPDHQWEITRLPFRGRLITVAQVSIGSHSVSLFRLAGRYHLHFEPRFYAFADGNSSHFESQLVVGLDGNRLPAYERCAETGEGCRETDRFFDLVLDEAAVELLIKGHGLLLDAATTAGERYRFRIPLAWTRDPFREVMNNPEVPVPSDDTLALIRAIDSGPLSAVRERVEAGADPGTRGPDGVPMAVRALEHGRPAIARYLVEQGAPIDIAYPGAGGDPVPALIQAAAEAKSPALLEGLLALGADPDIRSDDGKTALIAAAGWNYTLPERYALLLDAGASVDARDEDGRTALYTLMGKVHDPFVALAAYRILRAHGADLDARTDDGRTPLMLAIRMREYRLAERLLDDGADPALEADNGMDALDFARAVREQRMADGVHTRDALGELIERLEGAI